MSTRLVRCVEPCATLTICRRRLHNECNIEHTAITPVYVSGRKLLNPVYAPAGKCLTAYTTRSVSSTFARVHSGRKILNRRRFRRNACLTEYNLNHTRPGRRKLAASCGGLPCDKRVVVFTRWFNPQCKRGTLNQLALQHWCFIGMHAGNMWMLITYYITHHMYMHIQISIDKFHNAHAHDQCY